MVQDSEAPSTKHQSPDIRVSLDIHGFSCPPEEITELLHVSPTRVWHRGDSIPRTQLLRKEHHWILDAPGFSKTSLQEQLGALLDQTRVVAPRLLQLPADATTQVYCAVYDSYRTVILGFSAQLVRQIADLHAELNIDYYDMTPTQDRSD